MYSQKPMTIGATTKWLTNATTIIDYLEPYEHFPLSFN
jgi:hypothetical protein